MQFGESCWPSRFKKDIKNKQTHFLLVMDILSKSSSANAMDLIA